MESERFDALTRAIVAASSRRQLLGLVGGAAVAAVSAPFSRSSPVAAQGTPCQIGTVKVWLNSFIPGNVPDVTYPVPGGPFAGKTMIYNPIIGGDCFITDNRDFSPDPAASARMHSLIEIDVRSGTIVGGGMGTQRIGETVEVDCEDGDIECRKTGPTSRMHFSNFRVRPGSTGERLFSVDLKAAGQDWCFEISPVWGVCDIDYRGTFTVALAKTKDQATVTFDGFIDDFPAYEAYAAADGNPAQTLLREPPPSGNGPLSLCDKPPVAGAPAPRHVTGKAQVSCGAVTTGPGTGVYQFAGPLPDAEVAALGQAILRGAEAKSGTLSILVGLDADQRITRIEVTEEIVGDLNAGVTCGANRWRFVSSELRDTMTGAGLFASVAGTSTLLYTGSDCGDRPREENYDILMPITLYVVDERTLALCPPDKITRDECLASPIALLTGGGTPA